MLNYVCWRSGDMSWGCWIRNWRLELVSVITHMSSLKWWYMIRISWLLGFWKWMQSMVTFTILFHLYQFHPNKNKYSYWFLKKIICKTYVIIIQCNNNTGSIFIHQSVSVFPWCGGFANVFQTKTQEIGSCWPT